HPMVHLHHRYFSRAGLWAEHLGQHRWLAHSRSREGACTVLIIQYAATNDVTITAPTRSTGSTGRSKKFALSTSIYSLSVQVGRPQKQSHSRRLTSTER